MLQPNTQTGKPHHENTKIGKHEKTPHSIFPIFKLSCFRDTAFDLSLCSLLFAFTCRVIGRLCFYDPPVFPIPLLGVMILLWGGAAP
jgi:hypothetical protein